MSRERFDVVQVPPLLKDAGGAYRSGAILLKRRSRCVPPASSHWSCDRPAPVPDCAGPSAAAILGAAIAATAQEEPA